MFGCFSTIAVAWACAAWVPVGTQPQRYSGDGREGSGVGLWFVQRNDSFGVTRVESDHYVNVAGSFLGSVTPAAAILPEWAEAHIHLGGSTEQLRFFGTGLPLRALQCRVKLDTFGAGTDHWRGGFALKSRPADPPSPTMLVPTLPYQPIWIGFVVDTILFALAGGVLFAVVRTSFQARRSWRSRRHRCPACGYDLRHADHAACPECGRREAAAT